MRLGLSVGVGGLCLGAIESMRCIAEPSRSRINVTCGGPPPPFSRLHSYLLCVGQVFELV